MKYVVCVPYVYQPYFDEFIKTLKLPQENLLLIDNTTTNLGIMKSHNMGIDKMREVEADYLIVMSASMRFGEPGALDFIKHIEEHPEHQIIHGSGKWIDKGDLGKEKIMALGWHLTAFRKDVFDNVGKWDENFTPYGFDDVDLYLRIKKHYGDSFSTQTYPVDCRHESTSHSIQLAGVISPSGPLIAYFVEKWGRHPKAWEWDGWAHPFDDPQNNLKFWPPAPNGGRCDD